MKAVQEDKLEKEAKRIARMQKAKRGGGKDTYEGIPSHIQSLFGGL